MSAPQLPKYITETSISYLSSSSSFFFFGGGGGARGGGEGRGLLR